MATATKKTKSTLVPGGQPLPDPVTARPITVPKKKSSSKKKAAISRTEVVMIIDKSGSMYERVSDVVGGFNQYIGDLKGSEGADSTTVSVTLFDTTASRCYTGVPIKTIVPLTNDTYRPGGNTALLDAIGQTITEVEKALTDGTRVLVVIMTDGQENSSREYRKDTIRQMIKDREAKGNWTFVFMGADQDAFAEAGALGISAGNTLSHKGSDYQGAMKNLSVSTFNYARSGGQSCSKFFQPEDEPSEVVGSTNNTLKSG